MKTLLSFQQRIVPEMISLLDKRYHILKSIYYNQPIGRRALSGELDLGERIVRAEVNVLKEQGLVEINSTGMVVTREGESILENLELMIHEINGLNIIEDSIQKILNVSKVFVVPGDVDNDPTVLKEMGRIAAGYIKTRVNDNSTIAITGGSSVAQLVEYFPKITRSNIKVVPARGGIGSDVETQASTLASKLAHKIDADYKLLHVPDNLSHESLETIINEPEVKDVLASISNADILIFGIGRADEMANRRGLKSSLISEILDRGAVAEAFGDYFNNKGEIVYRTPTIGLNFDFAKDINNIIAIAGGKNKAEAIIALKTNNPNMVLVIDEGAAKEILILRNKEKEYGEQ